MTKRIAEIGAQITERFKGESVYLVCILKAVAKSLLLFLK